ncbi:MAG: DUF58 domain-containing protein [Spirochaetaceae bacterium]|jgi:uncharacterized protein (DUF58 family)|nr:DUF58 domain-containing protein [Spirochaetaceae bacterium]
MKRRIPVPKPRPLGIFALCISALGFAAGFLRGEPVLLLLGMMFAASTAYSYLAVFLLAMIHRQNAEALLVRTVPEKVSVLQNGTARLSRPAYFLSAPALIIRYKLLLATKDDKKIEYVFDGGFFKKTEADFPAARRGAYYGPHDHLIIQDIFGFFHHVLNLPHGGAERFLALPIPFENVPAIRCPANGSGRSGETQMRKTDDLTEQRPYIPGDDLRRINWKLYSHAGELFVRQEDREPPPHSRFILLIDTDACASLYSAEEGAAAVDDLCGIALALLIEKTADGSEVLFGFTGGETMNAARSELSTLLAYPTRTRPGDKDLPAVSGFHGEQSIVILALPRDAGMENSALYKFLIKRQPREAIQIIFFYRDENQRVCAEASARLLAKPTIHFSFLIPH